MYSRLAVYHLSAVLIPFFSIILSKPSDGFKSYSLFQTMIQEGLLEPITFALSRLRHLNTFELIHEGSALPLHLPSLGKIRSLSTLHLELSASTFNNLTFSDMLTQILSSSTQMSKIELNMVPPELNSELESVETFDFGKVLDRVEDPLPLTYLSLKHCTLLDPKGTVLKHLKNLQTLHLSQCITAWSSLQCPDVIFSIWDVLRQEGVDLRTLSVSRVDEGVLGYLSSYSQYSGLYDLSMDFADDLNDADGFVDDFFGVLVASHLETMERLEIKCDPFYNGPWLLSEGNVEHLCKFVELRELLISVGKQDIQNPIEASGPVSFIFTSFDECK